MVDCINLIIEMSPRFVLGRENVPCVAEVVNRSLKADCTDFTHTVHSGYISTHKNFPASSRKQDAQLGIDSVGYIGKDSNNNRSK